MLILGNGRVITRDDACPLIKNGAVAIDGTAICKVGGDEEVRKAYPGAEYIDAAGGLIMPALSMCTSIFTARSQEDFRSGGMTRRDFSISWMECGGRSTET